RECSPETSVRGSVFSNRHLARPTINLRVRRLATPESPSSEQRRARGRVCFPACSYAGSPDRDSLVQALPQRHSINGGKPFWLRFVCRDPAVLLPACARPYQ